MGFRDDSEATRARADALERENRDLRAQVEALQSPTTPEPAEPAQPGRMAGMWIAGGIVVLVLGVGLATTHRVPLVALPVFITVAMILITLGVVFTLLHVARPDEALVISGRRHRLPDGRQVDYRIVVGRPVVKLPLVERVDRLSLRTFPVSITVKHVLAKGGTAVDLEALAQVKISSNPALLPNAVELFLGSSPDEVARVAGEAIYCQTGSALADLTVEEIELDHDRVAHEIMSRADDDLAKRGLVVDALTIQQVRRG